MQKGLSKKKNIDLSFGERTTFFFDLDLKRGFKIPQQITLTFKNNNVKVKLKMRVGSMKLILLNNFATLLVCSILNIE